jgi:hypothetical protein
MWKEVTFFLPSSEKPRQRAYGGIHKRGRFLCGGAAILDRKPINQAATPAHNSYTASAKQLQLPKAKMTLPINAVRGESASIARATWRGWCLAHGKRIQTEYLHLSRKHRSKLQPTLYSIFWQADICLSNTLIQQLVL